jgi:hypothetical protein
MNPIEQIGARKIAKICLNAARHLDITYHARVLHERELGKKA